MTPIVIKLYNFPDRNLDRQIKELVDGINKLVTPMQIADAAGNTINPAKEDGNLATLVANQTNGTQKTLIITPLGDSVCDDIDDAIKVIDTEHHRVHTGELFGIDLYSTVTNGTPLYCQFKTGAKTVHLKQTYIVDGTDKLLCTFIENPTITDGTTPLSIVNRNRNSANTTTVNVYSDPAGVSGGTTLSYNYLSGTNLSAAPSSVSAIEWNLKPNTSYVHKLECLSAGTATFLSKLLWYEI